MTARLRYLLVALALACFAITVGALAQDSAARPDRDKDKAGTGDTTKGAITGRIVRVDAEARTLAITPSTTGRTGGADKDKGTGGTGTGGAADKDRTGGAGDRDKGKAGGDRVMTFTVPEKAKVTLDGKSATLKELKTGFYARVYADKGGSSGGGRDKAGSDKAGTGGRDKAGTGGTDKAGRDKDTTGRDKDTAGRDKDTAGRDKDKGGTTTGRTMMASRVEAFTKAPAGGTGGKSGGGTDRDR